jgi:hypothetical protein
MADFTLKRESIEEILDFSVLISTAVNKTEQRRLVSNKILLGFKIKSPALTKVQMQEYRNFIISKYGAAESFTFESIFDDMEYNVRFEQNTFRTTYEDGVFRCEFEFRIVY